MESRPALMKGCILLPYDTAAGLCRACGEKLSGAKRTWCGQGCQKMYERNHYWQIARPEAVKRDNNQCTKCGYQPDHWDAWVYNGQLVFWSRANLLKHPPNNWLEVNHIVPRVGQGYGTGCWHHLNAAVDRTCRVHVQVFDQAERPPRIIIECTSRKIAITAENCTNDSSGVIVVNVRSDFSEAALADGTRIPLFIEHCVVLKGGEAIVNPEPGGPVGALPGTVQGIGAGDTLPTAHQTCHNRLTDPATIPGLTSDVAVHRSTFALIQGFVTLETSVDYRPAIGGSLTPEAHVVQLAQLRPFAISDQVTVGNTADKWQTLHNATLRAVALSSDMPRPSGGLQTLCHKCHIKVTNRQRIDRARRKSYG